ncbi:hypothetical protein CY34DRAFT_96849 [Suillus luteus UH-Slu-Lm8-n1]|uniref:Uncharacterized protein n=1 Tax=Suillus luteus UH-Slu-Lm8-n1 TaxID=930992 RepID=A0A0D0AAE3_9AGAM|nr:hypothetical protein CY34DRAFT_96849 [Suillus luteus UH-Slu-Lm8-n1]
MILPRESRKCAPHDSFLCHAQSPDTCIAVETFMSENRLIVWLPGFMGNHIMIATRKNHTLHVVADSWEPQGGKLSAL